jgi:hypothetical protein
MNKANTWMIGGGSSAKWIYAAERPAWVDKFPNSSKRVFSP